MPHPLPDKPFQANQISVRAMLCSSLSTGSVFAKREGGSGCVETTIQERFAFWLHSAHSHTQQALAHACATAPCRRAGSNLDALLGQEGKVREGVGVAQGGQGGLIDEELDRSAHGKGRLSPESAA